MATARLGRVQFRIMQALWKRGSASAREITDTLNEMSPIAHSTVQTLLRQMESKAVITHDIRDRVFVFRPLVGPENVKRTATQDLIERIFGGSAAGLVAHLLTEERISATELQEMRKLIDRHNPKQGKKPQTGKRVERIMDKTRKVSIDSRGTTVLAVLLAGMAVTMLSALLSTSFPVMAADDPAASRQPAPDAAAQAKTQKVIHDVYGNYAAGSAVERAVTAGRMIEQAEATQNDPAGRFVLLKDAAELSAGIGDARSAIRAADLLGASYAIDANEMKYALLRKAAAVATGNNAQGVAEEGVACADLAVAAGNYELADHFMQPTDTAARSAKNVSLLLSVQARAVEIKWMQLEESRSKLAADKLAKNPNDPDASLTQGRYLCLVKGDWKAGLPGLVKGPSPALHAAAAADLANPESTDKRIAAGDMWWDAAEKEQAGSQKALRRRAAYWYSQAMADPQFAGLGRARVEKRMSQAPPIGEAVANVPPVGQPAVPSPAVEPPPVVVAPPVVAPGKTVFTNTPASGNKNIRPGPGATAAPGRTIDLLSHFDVKGAVAGTWTIDHGALVSDDTKYARIQSTYRPPAEYDYVIEFTRPQGKGNIVQLLSVGDTAFEWSIGANGESTRLENIGGHARNKTAHPMPEGLRDQKRHTSVVQVRKTGLTFLLDGQSVLDFPTDYTDLTRNKVWTMNDDHFLGLGALEGPFIFHSVKVIEVDGTSSAAPTPAPAPTPANPAADTAGPAKKSAPGGTIFNDTGLPAKK